MSLPNLKQRPRGSELERVHSYVTKKLGLSYANAPTVAQEAGMKLGREREEENLSESLYT